jgi:hypothetical protein
MPDTTPPRPHYELHTYHGTYWLRARRFRTGKEAMAAAEQAGADRTGQAVRIARCVEHPGYGYVSRTIVYRAVEGDTVVDPAAPLVLPDAPDVCVTPADLRSERARETIAGVLGRWLEENRATVIELLHSEALAVRLNNTGTILQGALQKVAVAQASGTDVPVQKRYRELVALADATISELHAESRRNPAPALAPGEYGRWCAALAQGTGAGALEVARFRALAASLADCRTWLAKLDRLGSLAEDGLPVRDIAPLDAIAAEVISMPGAAAELAGPGADRLAVIGSLIRVHAGRIELPHEPGLTGIDALNRLIRTGRCPRLRGAVQKRLLVELAGTAPLQANAALWNLAQALHMLRERMAEAPPLGDDLELRDALELRALRGISPESVAEILAKAGRSPSDRFRALIRLADLMPYASSKARVLEFAAGAFSIDDLVREAAGPKGDRAAAIPKLVELHRMVAGAEIDAEAKTRLCGELDGAVGDLIRIDVLGAQGRPFFDRVMQLIRLCSTCPLPEGRARRLATEAVGRAVMSQEFLTPFLKRFSTETEKKQALTQLRDLLVAAGLGRSTSTEPGG